MEKYHVTKHPDGSWQVLLGTGSKKAIKKFKTQAEANEYAKELAEKRNSTVYLHGKNGRVRDTSSYKEDEPVKKPAAKKEVVEEKPAAKKEVVEEKPVKEVKKEAVKKPATKKIAEPKKVVSPAQPLKEEKEVIKEAPVKEEVKEEVKPIAKQEPVVKDKKSSKRNKIFIMSVIIGFIVGAVIVYFLSK